MLSTSKLPLYLAPETYVTAGYLRNRTPTRSISWKTLFEMAYYKKPLIAYLKIYGCRAYTLRTQIPRGNKLTSRALIGYLVGYDVLNIYRIWIPKAKSKAYQGKVIRTRDVTFREDMFYQVFDSQDPLLQGEEIQDVIHTIHMPPLQNSEESSKEEDEDAITAASHSSTPTPETQPSTRTARKRKRRDLIEQSVDTNAAANRELIDSNLRHSRILLEGAVRSRKPTRKSSSFFVSKYWTTFVAASITAPKTRCHHSTLPPEPRFYQDVMKLPTVHKQGFIAAMQREISDIKRKDTYKTIS